MRTDIKYVKEGLVESNDADSKSMVKKVSKEKHNNAANINNSEVRSLSENHIKERSALMA